MMPTPPRPPFDPELGGVLAAIAETVPPTITPEMIERFRTIAPDPTVGGLVAAVGAARDELAIPGYGEDPIEVTVFRPSHVARPGPGILYLHGGGMVFGNRFGGVGAYLPFIAGRGATVVAVSYRLAPEHPDPVPVEDCYATLRWAAESGLAHVDPTRLVVAGQSAGAGLAAGVTLLARERGGPAIAGQILVSPMLDDRSDSVSAQQIDGVGVWDRQSNLTGWDALLGERRGRDDVSPSAAPARADDLSGLPPAFISVGSAEVFRDEAVSYASRIWAAGGAAELHVWPGAFHGFENFAPYAAVTTAATAARDAWLTRLLDG